MVECRDALEGTLHEDGEVVPVLVEQLELEGIGQLVGRHPGLGLGLEAADHQAPHLLLEVRVPVRVPQDGQIGVDPLDPLGHHVEVLGRVQGHVDPGQRTHRLGPLAGTVDDHLGPDPSPVGHHPGHPAVLLLDTGHPGAFEDPGTPVAGATGQRRGHVDRVGRAVTGQPDGAHQVLDGQGWVELLRPLRADQLALEVVDLGRRRRPAQLAPSAPRCGPP